MSFSQRITKGLLVACMMAVASPAPAAEGELEAVPLGKRVFAHSFAVTSGQETLRHRFRLRNDGASPVRIVNSRMSCGCLSVTSLPSVVSPGQTAAFEFALDLSGKRGHVEEKAWIVTDDPGDSIVFDFSAVVRAVWTEPVAVDFGNVRRGKAPDRRVFVVASGADDAVVEAIAVSSDNVSASLVPTKTDAVTLRRGIKSFACIRITWNRRAEDTGQVRAKVQVTTRAGGVRKEVTIPVTGYSSGGFDVKPNALLFGEVSGGGTLSRAVVLSTETTEDLSKVDALRFETDHKFVSARVEKSSDGSKVVINVDMCPPTSTAQGVFNGTIRGQLGSKDLFGIPYIGRIIK
jgi:hypothetical protein